MDIKTNGRGRDREISYSPKKGSSFSLLRLDFHKPGEALSVLAFWLLIGFPLGTGLIWGIANKDNLAGILGVSARRAIPAAIDQTKPVGDKMCSLISNGCNANGQGNPAP